LSPTTKRTGALRVAILIGRFPPHDVGGAERQADRLAQALAERGHDVTVITRRWPGRAARETRGGVTIVRTPVALFGPVRSALDAAVTLGTLRRMRPAPDVVLAFQSFVSGWIAGLADAWLGLPSVVWVRGENEYRFDRLPRLYPPAKLAWKQARRVLVQAEAHRTALLANVAERNPLLAERIAPRLEVLGNGVDLPESPAPPGDDWLYVGRLIAHKRVDLLLEALAASRGTPAERPLWIVGDGPERAALEARARALGVDARFEGMRPRPELASYHARARAIVLPSTEGEGLPNALLEAMAAGVPAVATDVPGVAELVDGAGVLAAPGDAGSLADALRRLSDPTERARASAAARARAAECGFDVVAGRLEHVLREAAATAPRIWLVGPDPGSRGGVAAVGRQFLVSPLGRNYRLAHLSTYEPGSVGTRLRAAGWGVGKIAGALLFRPPDLIQIQVASTGSFARKIVVGSMARARGVPMVVRIHGGGFDQFLARSPGFVLAAARWWLKGADQVIALSERWAERLRPLLPGVTIDVVPNPIEVARFADLAAARFARWRSGEPDPAPHALFLGDVIGRKGVFDLIAAWAEVVRRHPAAQLTLAGTGDLEGARAAAKEAGVEANVALKGWVNFPEKRRLLGEATLFVLPSYVEGVPISLLEAMAAGLPSVVTPVGGVLDAITDGEEAFVVAPGDRAALARALLSLVESPARARELAETARRRADAFDITVYAAGLDAVYHRILGARAPLARIEVVPRGERGERADAAERAEGAAP
jgi:glycosyltransferase involved in cell wall biosynthesis